MSRWVGKKLSVVLIQFSNKVPVYNPSLDRKTLDQGTEGHTLAFSNPCYPLMHSVFLAEPYSATKQFLLYEPELPLYYA